MWTHTNMHICVLVRSVYNNPPSRYHKRILFLNVHLLCVSLTVSDVFLILSRTTILTHTVALSLLPTVKDATAAKRRTRLHSLIERF